jgi:hypothetical protein
VQIGNGWYFGKKTCGALNALLRLIDQLPNSLIPSDPSVYADFIQSQESIRFAIKMAESHNYAAYGPSRLTPDGGDKPNQVQTIRNALASCPDEAPPRQSKELPFIRDPDIRKGLLIDLTAVRSALGHAEWKASTVLAGSLVEALLLWQSRRILRRFQVPVPLLLGQVSCSTSRRTTL